MKMIQLKNGRRDYRLVGGYQSVEKFLPNELLVGERVKVTLSEEVETKMKETQLQLIVASVNDDSVVFSNDLSPDSIIVKACLVRDSLHQQVWSYIIFIDGIEILPKMTVTNGFLNDLLEEIREDVFAVCLEGSMAGRILSIKYKGLGWDIDWEHNNERASGFLHTKFALIDNRGLIILKSSKVNVIQNIKSLNYELGVAMAQIADIHNLDDPKVDQFITMTSSVGHENLVREDFYHGFMSERANMKFIHENSYEKFIECLNHFDIPVKDSTDWGRNLANKRNK